MFHSARWNHDYDLTGKRVAVVGTGASAIQFVPEIQPEVAQLHVFQRTPPWVMPHPNRPITRCGGAAVRSASRCCSGSCAARSTASASCSCSAFVKHPKLMKAAGADRAPAHAQRRSPTRRCARRSRRATRSAASGSCPPTTGTRRSRSPTSSCVTDGVERGAATLGRDRATAWSARSTRSSSAPASRSPTCRSAGLVRGRGGSDARRGLGRAARGPTSAPRSPGFPNLFMLLGPNTGLGHSSMVYMIESQIAYVMDALRAMRRARRRHASRSARTRRSASTPTLDERMQGTVWNTRLRELVPRRDRPQLDAVAGLDVALPAAHRELRPRGLRADPAHAG